MTNILSEKLKLFSVPFSIIAVVLFFISLVSFPSCKTSNNDTWIRRIDTLINRNNKAKDLLIIDDQSIKLRVDSMKVKISALDSNSINSGGAQLRSDMIQYNGLLLRYIDFLENYSVIEYDNSINAKILDKIKKDIVDHKTDLKSLDSLLNYQEKVIESHLKQTQEIVKNLLSIEEMYQRMNNRINSVYKMKINISK